jgi:class 3 adenylate cyclase/tetratricopeptide (TPR) repeat protein
VAAVIRDPVVEALESFVSPLVLERSAALGGGAITVPWGERFPAAVLFADISGFTALTERLAQKGPPGVEELTRVVNSYFERLIEAIASAGGMVVKFAGDALLALFPAREEPLRAATLRAAHAALVAQAAMKRFSTSAESALSLRVSVGAGDVVVAHVGGVLDRREVLVAGRPLAQAGTGNALGKPGDVVASEEVAMVAGPSLDGEPLAQGAILLRAVRDPPEPRRYEPPPARERAAVVPYVPAAIRARVDAGQTAWLAELRRVTVVFANLAGIDHTTRLERAQEVMRALQERVYRYEGSVNKLSVDDKGATLIAVYGLPPLSHEDDPARGAQAGLALADALRALGIPGSVGVTTGRAFCGSIGGAARREYTIMGDVVNLAARLMQAAKGGGVLCDEATFQAARERVGFEALPSIQVKGKASAVAVYRPQATSTGTIRRRRARGLVGRSVERATIAEALAALGAGERRGPILIEGPPGMGKSRLLANALEEAASLGIGFLAAAGDAIEKAAPYHAWRPVLREVLRLAGPGADAASDRAAALARLAPRPDLAGRAPLLDDVLHLGIPPTEETRDLAGEARADNVRRLIAGVVTLAAEEAPLVLAVEDAQWLDSASWAALLALARARPPVLCVVAARSSAEAAPAELLRLLELPGARRIALAPLEPEETAALLRARWGAAEVPEEVATLVHERSQGNPFYAEAVADALLASGRVEVGQGSCRLAAGATLAGVGLPDTVEGLIMGRIDRLAPAQQLAVKAASVIGRTFAVSTLAEIYPVAEERGRVPDMVADMARSRLARPVGGEHGDGAAGEGRAGAPGREVFAFTEHATHEVAYNLMAFAQRKSLHRDVAAALERRHAHDLDAVAPILAYHWSRAEDEERAARWLGRAGELAVEGYANREAVEYLERAIALAARLPGVADAARLARWERRLASAHYALGRIALARDRFRRALALLGLPTPTSPLGQRLRLLREVARQAWRRLRDRPPAPPASPEERERLLDAARAHQRLTQVHFFSQETVASVLSSVTALNLAERAGPSEELCASYANACLASGIVLSHRFARAYGRRALAMAERVGRAPARAYVLFVLGVYAAGTGAWEEAEASLAEGAAIATRTGDGRRFDECTANRATVANLRGRLAESLALYEDVLRSSTSRDDRQARAWAFLGTARSMIGLGRLDEALERIQAGQALLAQELEQIDRPNVAQTQGLLALVRLRRGEMDAAGGHADAVANWVAGSRASAYYSSHVYAAAAETRLAILERAVEGGTLARERAPLVEAARASCRALERFARTFAIARPAAALWRGLLTRLEGDLVGALACWDRSREAAERLAMPLDRALALRETARHLPRGAERRARLEEAAALLDGLGAALAAKASRDAARDDGPLLLAARQS